MADQLGERIKQAREERILTQEEAADELGISYRSLQDYEQGAAAPRPARRRRILAWLEQRDEVPA